MSSKTAADVLIETIHSWGVDIIFGIPGDGINGIIEALRKRQDKIRFIQVRHEESAAFMACAYAKYTGKLGCCIATSGPGGIHLLNGLYDAKLDGQPVLAITGLQFHDLVGTHTQQDVALDKLFMDVSVYNERIMGPMHVEAVTHLACRTALAYRGVSHITMPVDMQSMDMKEGHKSERNEPAFASNVFARSTKLPPAGDLDAAAQILNAGKKVAILAGAGALGAGAELEQIADLLGAPIIKPILGKACVPDDSPFCTGSIGLLGTLPSQEAIEDCDTLLMVGTSFPYLEFMPKPGQAKAVQIDINPIRIGLRYDIDVGLVGDSHSTLADLSGRLKRKDNRSFLTKAQKGMKEWEELMKGRGTRTDFPLKPQVVAYELNKRLTDNAIISCDSGSITTWWARYLKARGEQKYSLSGTLATMASGLPYTLAAQLAFPDRQCVAVIGDGAFSMLMADFVTAVKYELPIKVIVFSNRSLAQIKWEQMVFLGNPEYVCDLAPIDFAAVARACGGTGFMVDKAEDLPRILDQAFATPGPVVVDCIVDPHEPPMPPKVKAKQALHFAESLAKGTPNRGKIAITSAKNTVRELV
ncbi:MAG: thiamine pyrophosphate-dependent enzyme [Akkermansiaceae bacterium]